MRQRPEFEHIRWSDSFQRMRVKEEASARGPFTQVNCRWCLMRRYSRPITGQCVLGEAAGVWLPLLSLFTGARQSELAGLSPSDEPSACTMGFLLSGYNWAPERDCQIQI